ncbi:chromosome partition protein [Bifidobacterium actinocoloniiforme DSM 22766]|uniref:Chromosome partition protein Smc n=1 Tax=Bifidobacterium actinocoloniiforme DSM 22766 TaxID=1437605 RepID=A0A086Z0Z4_9BIFI|nr:chromosome segregation protein SMC [Bifidobacterium actinocoloniiforme]AKV55376.1 chromosome segregation protein SMC [Bifidobacterium actinocoloniiforme DSM 22766]KFI40194.1 chromosome partition protein [Bifidobacterium actinocoloniiforme DSM 22766]
MYLKELSLRGFKSFAAPTTLRFEPGITAVVGPNGSGKSNIVDALAWVMGEQGAKALRGSSMEDVIFAGTSSRPPLGRAQVSLTIDNSDRTLGIDYTEVTISRTIFRNGGSEYAINGSACRLLDIQELLSDTGLGQQMHVIVGQGRLDAILRADPSGHRAFIEEAAGILKHRKRKERALRKLANTDDNLARLDDLLSEIHRQLGPLGRQARVSRRADGIEVSLRDAQARIYAEDAVKARQSLDDVREELGRVREELAERQRHLAQVKLRIEQVEALSQKSNPRISRINQVWHDLTQLQERYSSLISLAGERARSLQGQMEGAGQGPDPELLARRAEELDAQGRRQASRLEESRLTLDQAVEVRASQEQQLAAARQTLTELQRTARQHDAQLTSLKALVAKEESALQLVEGRLSDAQVQRDAAAAQLTQAHEQEESLELEAQAGAGQGEDGLAAQEEAERARAAARQGLNDAQETQRKINSQRIALEAKADALSDTLESRSASERLSAEGGVRMLGRLADFIQVEEGWEEPVAHALADYSGAIVVRDGQGVQHALEKAHQDKLGKAVLLTPLDVGHEQGQDLGQARAPASTARRDRIRSAASLVSARSDVLDSNQAQGVLAAVRLLLSRTAAVETGRDAMELLASAGSTAKGAWDEVLTREGDVFTAVGAIGGSGPATSDLALVARRDKALAGAQGLSGQLDAAQKAVDRAQQSLTQAEDRLEEAKAKRTEDRLKAEQGAKALASARTLTRQQEARLQTAEHRIEVLGLEVKSHQAKLEDLQGTLQQAERSGSEQVNVDELTERARRLEEALDQARAAEMKAQMAWNDAKGKGESLARQSQLLRTQAQEAQQRRERVARLNQERAERISLLGEVGHDARAVVGLLAASLEQTVEERDRLQSQVSSHDSELKDLRTQRDGLEPQVEVLRAKEHDLDVSRERLATQSGQLIQKISDDLGMGVDELIRDYGPERPVPVLDETGAPVPMSGSLEEHRENAGNDQKGADALAGHVHVGACETVPYVREEQIKRLNKAKRDLAALGKVNPLAAEEYESLKARNQYLNDQRQDVVSSRDDLKDLIKDLDRTMIDVFKSAFDDTAAAFEQMFATLFPGGKGRLRMENPDDLLTTGVLVEASPAGKKVKQLSLLSGGERSLTALALLFAIFTARPSPFYVMDEVEAALDDVNLSRLLKAFNQLREHAQLIIITHQQRTMSIADALYGVTMRADGVTAVISQKLAQGQEALAGD